MRGKLNKVDNGWVLLVDNIMYATDNDKLSIKNCQAIERGYDLDELVDSELKGTPKGDERAQRYYGFINGFQKALELMGDKKFSEEDMLSFESFVSKWYDKAADVEEFTALPSELLIKWESLQQTEWEVEVEMICPHPSDTYRCGIQYGCDEDGCNHPNQIPYLDAEGCLILKRI